MTTLVPTLPYRTDGTPVSNNLSTGIKKGFPGYVTSKCCRNCEHHRYISQVVYCDHPERTKFCCPDMDPDDDMVPMAITSMIGTCDLWQTMVGVD